MTSQGSYPAGTRINDRYVLRSLLGLGSSGEVHRAHDEHLDIEVALKLLRPVGGVPADWVEARVLEQLHGDYLLPVYNADVVQGSDLRYIATSIMSGGDLADAADPLGVTTQQAVRWASQLAHAAERVHVAGLLHRDIKPGNGYLDANGDANLADLGMAVRFDSSGRAGADGTLVTVAPEALSSSNAHCTIRSDIYSLGATAFYLLTGDYPVSQKFGRAECRDRVVAGNRSKVRDLSPHVSQAVGSVIERSLALDPSRRQTSALELANQLVAAKQLDRHWQRVSHGSGHIICLRGPDKGARRTIVACVIKTGGSRARLEVSYEGGNRIRRHEKADFPESDSAKILRAFCASV